MKEVRVDDLEGDKTDGVFAEEGVWFVAGGQIIMECRSNNCEEIRA